LVVWTRNTIVLDVGNVNTLLLLMRGVLHNNYVPWVSIWVIAAIVEAFAVGVSTRVI
jgi:hypothetical protein